MDSEIETIFKQNSTSYYYSTLLFPKDVREDVFKLYSYVRVLDEFVDHLPQEPDRMERYRDLTMDNWDSGETDEKIVNAFLEVARDNDFEKEWVKAFLDSMQMDLEKQEYETMDETLEYIHGSAEVIGYMMADILDLPEEAFDHAALLGRAMQYCNFLRDVEEDLELGRRYLPREEMEKFGLDTLERRNMKEKNFEKFMQAQLDHYFEWQREAESGFSYIPYRERVPVILSSRIYRWTARKISEDPLNIYEGRIVPSKLKIFQQLVLSLRGKK